MIHPSAVIDADCKIAQGVTIGPFSVIGAGVTIGKGTSIASHVVIQGKTTIGEENNIFQFSSIGEIPQDKKYSGEETLLQIGDRNTIREYVTIHRGTVQDRGVTSIGNDNLLMAYTHVAHDSILKDHIIMSNGSSLAGHVVIDDYAILSGFTLVHQFCSIGAHSFTAMGTAVNRDVPPYLLVSGSPAVPRGINSEGLKRRGFDSEAVRLIKDAYKLLYHSGLKLGEAAGQIAELAGDSPQLAVMVDFLENSRRSIVR
ncbi:MAG TPA: acyl-[acyl-carrier-protein]--UDP-N-acetylglucosamine O-acyltransferase [Gammaproteobacteria bacterium]|nr:acyl-[acyl-carrier-protein]--UDP-N-acetylglucosamine O-acyltransferase [Gammaproteobacteria bacterium]